MTGSGFDLVLSHRLHRRRGLSCGPIHLRRARHDGAEDGMDHENRLRHADACLRGYRIEQADRRQSLFQHRNQPMLHGNRTLLCVSSRRGCSLGHSVRVSNRPLSILWHEQALFQQRIQSQSVLTSFATTSLATSQVCFPNRPPNAISHSNSCGSVYEASLPACQYHHPTNGSSTV